MPEIINFTPFPNFRYYSRDTADNAFGIVIVKASYEIAANGDLLAAEEQAPMMFTDKCHGEVNVTSLWHPSDLVPNKPATDLIINAVARAPGGQPSPSWECGISVQSAGQSLVSKRLRISGPRHWRPVWKRALSETDANEWQKHLRHFSKWELSEPEPIIAVPLHYEYAYGGLAEVEGDDGERRTDTNHHNPLGRGRINPDFTDHTKPVPAPQIEAIDDPIVEPYKDYTPENIGPIPPAWLPRRPLGGTYDQAWLDSRWPAWPEDYNFRYHNSAPAGLAVEPYLRGGETVTVTGMSAAEELRFRLPSQTMIARFARRAADGWEAVNMNLDTVFLDFGSGREQDWRVYLTWRVNFEPDTYASVVLETNVA